MDETRPEWDQFGEAVEVMAATFGGTPMSGDVAERLLMTALLDAHRGDSRPLLSQVGIPLTADQSVDFTRCAMRSVAEARRFIVPLVLAALRPANPPSETL